MVLPQLAVGMVFNGCALLVGECFCCFSRAYTRARAIVFSGIFSFTFHFWVDGWDFGGMSGGGELFGGEAVFLEKVLEYFSESTAVLSRQYSSTLGAVLEYCHRSTGVFLLEYSSIPRGVLEYPYRSARGEGLGVGEE